MQDKREKKPVENACAVLCCGFGSCHVTFTRSRRLCPVGNKRSENNLRNQNLAKRSHISTRTHEATLNQPLFVSPGAAAIDSWDHVNSCTFDSFIIWRNRTENRKY